MRHTIVFVLALLTATVAHAQTTQAAPNGPLILERIHDGWVLAPDVKVTDVDHRTGELAGAYGGRLVDGTIFIGGAGYWLANDARDFKLAYGGLVVGWQSPEVGRIRFGGRGLVGAGRATLGFDVGLMPAVPVQAGPVRPGNVIPVRGYIRFGVTNPGGPAPGPARAPVPPQPQSPRGRLVAHDDFLVFEPQVNVSARLTRSIGVSCGVGYRDTAQVDILRGRLNGPTANFAVQFGW